MMTILPTTELATTSLSYVGELFSNLLPLIFIILGIQIFFLILRSYAETTPGHKLSILVRKYEGGEEEVDEDEEYVERGDE